MIGVLVGWLVGWWVGWCGGALVCWRVGVLVRWLVVVLVSFSLPVDGHVHLAAFDVQGKEVDVIFEGLDKK